MSHSQSRTAQALIPPEAFGIIEPNVYRSSIITQSLNFPFIKSLQLKTFVYLSPDTPGAAFKKFLQDYGTEFVHLGLKSWRPAVTWKPISEELIKDALEIVLDVSLHPVMVACSSGVHQTGTLVGCLRRLQYWDLTSVLDEYRRYAGTKWQFEGEQFIELFDTDLVTLPSTLPSWFLWQRQMMEEEQREFEELCQSEAKITEPAYRAWYYDPSGPVLSARAAQIEAERKARLKALKASKAPVTNPLPQISIPSPTTVLEIISSPVTPVEHTNAPSTTNGTQ